MAPKKALELEWIGDDSRSSVWFGLGRLLMAAEYKRVEAIRRSRRERLRKAREEAAAAEGAPFAPASIPEADAEHPQEGTEAEIQGGNPPAERGVQSEEIGGEQPGEEQSNGQDTEEPAHSAGPTPPEEADAQHERADSAQDTNAFSAVIPPLPLGQPMLPEGVNLQTRRYQLSRATTAVNTLTSSSQSQGYQTAPTSPLPQETTESTPPPPPPPPTSSPMPLQAGAPPIPVEPAPPNWPVSDHLGTPQLVAPCYQQQDSTATLTPAGYRPGYNHSWPYHSYFYSYPYYNPTIPTPLYLLTTLPSSTSYWTHHPHQQGGTAVPQPPSHSYGYLDYSFTTGTSFPSQWNEQRPQSYLTPQPVMYSC